MKDWIDVKEKKPSGITMTYATNARRGKHCFLAVYFPDIDCFILDCERAPLDVTHYIELPIEGPYGEDL